MKLTMSLVLALIGFVTGSEASDATSAASNSTSLQQACLQLPSRELILDVRHESLEYGTRRDAGEFLGSVLNVLLAANYTVRLSDDFIQSEINYYRENLSREVPVEMSRAILSCLESSRASGVLDWNCFKGDFNRSAEPMNVERHLPWSAPPFKAKSITLAGIGATNLTCLQLSLKWTGRNYGGAVQHTRRPGGLAGETVLTEGKNSLWAFDGVLRLSKAGQTLFEKAYPHEEWQRSYSTVYDRPLWKTSQAILQDLASGLRPNPAPVDGGQKTKARKQP